MERRTDRQTRSLCKQKVCAVLAPGVAVRVLTPGVAVRVRACARCA
jgi:hypothetical protein